MDVVPTPVASLCIRCDEEITKGQRKVDDPCCSAPDCEGFINAAHYSCLSITEQDQEDENDYISREW